MSHTTLVLALAFGSLPVTLMLCSPKAQPAPPPPQYGEPNLGDCRPDIGPGGIIQIHPDPANPTTPNGYKATIITTPLPTGEFVYVGNGTNMVKLTPWDRYIIAIDYTATPVQARLLDRSSSVVLQGFPTVDVYTRLSSDANNPFTSFAMNTSEATDRKVYDHAFSLQVHHKKVPTDPALASYHQTTFSMIKAP